LPTALTQKDLAEPAFIGSDLKWEGGESMRQSNLGEKSEFLAAIRVVIILSLICSQFFTAYSATSFAAEEKFTVSKIEIQGNTLFSQQLLQKATQGFLGRNKTIRDLEMIQNAVFSVYKKAGYSLVSVLIVNRPDNEGRLTIIVKEDILRSVKIQGNKYLHEDHVRKALPALKTGYAINTKKLDNQILFANENTSRVIKVSLQPIDVGVFDAIVTVKEDRMITQSLSLDNTGNRYQDPVRIRYRFADAGLGNRRDATGMFIYSQSPNGNIREYLGYYNQPLSPRHGDNLFLVAAYSNNSTGLSQTGYGDFNTAGAGHFYGFHYVRPFFRSTGTKLGLDFGLEYRQSIDNTDFGGIKLYPDINSFPFSITFQSSWQGKADTLSSNISYVRNIPGGYLNNDFIYGIIWPGASSSYQLWRGNVNYLHRFKKDWLFNNRYNWQYTTQSLIPDEQFGLGGVNSVRGFEERELTGDKGFSANFEIYTPQLGHGIRLLAFYDIGQIWGYDFPFNGGDLLGPATISSTGIGIRWPVNKWLTINADYAYVLQGAATTPTHDTRIHFEMTALF
jgi:hemolysin activation/secretion protein